MLEILENMALFTQIAINLPVCCLDDGIPDKSSHGRLRKRKANQTFMIKEYVEPPVASLL